MVPAVLLVVIVISLITPSACAEEKETSDASVASATPNEADATDLSKPNVNHKLLGELAGTWNYILRISMGPNKPPVETDGVAVRNAKQKFVSVWIDNGSTAITIFEGTYDPASRTFTYNSETEPRPGKKTKVREVIKVTDSNHYSLEGFEEHGDHEMETVEINYTRASAK